MDTADPEEGSSPTEKWIGESDAVIITYNVSKLPWRSTPLQVIRNHHEAVKQVKTGQKNDLVSFPVLILGTQNDRVEERVLEAEEGQALADKLGCEFAECSALEGDVERPIYDLVRSIREQRQKAQASLKTEALKKEGEHQDRKGDRFKGVLDQLEDLSHKAWIFG
jgi:GTPase KRas protein